MSRNLVLILYVVGLGALLFLPRLAEEGKVRKTWNHYAPDWARDSSAVGWLEGLGRSASSLTNFSFSGPDLEGIGNGPEGDATVASGSLPPARTAKSTRSAPVVKVAPKEKKLDKLTKDDREELNDLFSGLDK